MVDSQSDAMGCQASCGTKILENTFGLSFRTFGVNNISSVVAHNMVPCVVMALAMDVNATSRPFLAAEVARFSAAIKAVANDSCDKIDIRGCAGRSR